MAKPSFQSQQAMMTTKYTDKQRQANYKLRSVLAKLGIQSAFGGPLIFEPIDAILKSVTFDASKLVLWTKIPKN